MANKYIIEFIGTFFLVLTVALSGNPLAVGAVLTAMVYMGGYISGAHFNPAVSTALFLQKKLNLNTWLNYCLVQLAAAIVASSIYLLVKDAFFSPGVDSTVNFWHAFLLEILFTFALVSVVLHTAVSEKTKDNHYFGLAIGFIVAAGAFAAGPISGAAFNPAVGIGPLLLNFQELGNNLNDIILYLSAPLIGGVLASYIFTQVLKR